MTERIKGRKYPSLTKTFFKGSFKGQMYSIYRDREIRPDKVADFKRAVEEGDCVAADILTKRQWEKLNELGIALPVGFCG